ncbi:hypothetical protein HG537_0C05120 [Torulaspora globosa]|uniref:Activator of Hsp90 ATPase AHSA1-like N-terminal domain-containing protein n=1 Tax=Torulaspora globosa TaxID=48254 RepID=A0A7H9HRF0_9SACH|nr:hypothetical protein HG537_0C05120 [Torulaspora sp. CBS 2947]
MVVLNPNNWHWVDKNTLPWTKGYFEQNLCDLEIICEDGKHKIILTKVTSVSGDSNVSQRKGKPICYFDLRLTFAVKILQIESEDELANGSLEIPEFMHDETEFEIKYQDFKEFEQLVRSEFYPKIHGILLEYQPTLIREHSKDLQEC